MGKKSRISAAAAPAAASASTSRSNLLMANLKTVNAHLAKEAAECRKKIEQLRLQLTSMAADNDILHGIEGDVCTIVLSSGLGEAAAQGTAEMAAAAEKQGTLMKKTETAAAEVEAAERELLAVVGVKDGKKRELAELKEKLRSMEEDRERAKLQRRKWLYRAAAAAFVATATVAFCASFKK